MRISLIIFLTTFVSGFAYPQTKNKLGERITGGISTEDVIFLLFTKDNAETGTRLAIGDTETLNISGFKAENPTKILTHGFLDDFYGHVRGFKNDFLSIGDFNIILVDWSKCALDIRYELAVACSKQVGNYIGYLIQFLTEQASLSVKDVHLLGHSLGGEVMAFVSEVLPDKVGRISAMDPAGPLFEHEEPSGRLDPEDADFVDAIHTSTIFYGIKRPVGHVDFYPNGGNNQPGCDNALSADCNHAAAHHYYSNTIKDKSKYIGNKCESVGNAKNGTCFGEKGIMGYDAVKTSPGIYYLEVMEPPA